jgi:ribulose 1,5-bisphosphate synthetase/thiazole synthase
LLLLNVEIVEGEDVTARRDHHVAVRQWLRVRQGHSIRCDDPRFLRADGAINASGQANTITRTHVAGYST